MSDEQNDDLIPTTESAQIGGAYERDQDATFDVGLFLVLAAMVAFMVVTNLWLRWRADRDSVFPWLGRLFDSIFGRSDSSPET
jgi:hypothetical protein